MNDCSTTVERQPTDDGWVAVSQRHVVRGELAGWTATLLDTREGRPPRSRHGQRFEAATRQEAIEQAKAAAKTPAPW